MLSRKYHINPKTKLLESISGWVTRIPEETFRRCNEMVMGSDVRSEHIHFMFGQLIGMAEPTYSPEPCRACHKPVKSGTEHIQPPEQNEVIAYSGLMHEKCYRKQERRMMLDRSKRIKTK